MNQIVNIKIQGRQPSTDGLTGSLKLAQEVPEQASATVFDVATIIDQMHGVEDPCQNTRNQQSYQPEPAEGVGLPEHQQNYLQNKYSTTSALEKLAGEFGGNCLAKQGKPVTIEVFAFWSNEEIADNYKLICPVGRIDNQRRVQKRMRLKISVSGASSVDFGYYVKERVFFSDFYEIFWVGGNVVDIYGKRKSIHAPQWDGGTILFWNEPIKSGHIFLEFDTIYDIWDCTLQGVWTDSKRDYAATVTGIWTGTAPELPLVVPKAEAEEAEPCSSLSNTADAVDLSVPSTDPPEPVDPAKPECEQRIDYEVRGRCTGKLIDYWTEYVPAPCEDGKNQPNKLVLSFAADPGYDCGSACTAEGYEEICCRPSAGPGCVPTCLEYNSVNRGGLLPPGGMDGLKARYGDDVQIVWVYPEDGYCGVHTDKLVMPGGGCDECEGVAELVWSEGNPDIIAPGGSVTVAVTGGGPDKPITWSLQGGSGYALTGGGTSYVGGSSVDVYASLDVCGKTTVKAADDCSDASGPLDHSGGVSFLLDEATVLPNHAVNCYITDGKPPYDWDLSGPLTEIFGGGPYDTVITVRLDAGSCDGGTVTVSDECSSDDLPIINGVIDVSLSGPDELFPPSPSYPAGQAGNIYVADGQTPYSWQVSGGLVIIYGGGPYDNVITVRNTGGGGAVTVADACSSASHDINDAS